jgi:uncharacterized protein YciI
MSRTFAAIVQRASSWDQSKPPQEQSGFESHVKYMGALEAEGFVALAGLMKDSGDVLFIFRAESEAEIRNRLSQDPWQRDGYTRLVRVEEIHIRIGAPQPPAGYTLAAQVSAYFSWRQSAWINLSAYSDPNRHPFRWQNDTRSDPNRHLFRSKSAPQFRVR